MLNRRHLRIKVLQILYAFFQSEGKDMLQAEKELFRSINKMHDLYLYFLLIFEELQNFGERRIEDKKNKIRPTEDDLNPNRKFVDNHVFRFFAENQDLRRNSEYKKINWGGAEKNDLMRKLFVRITESDLFEEYMSSRETSPKEERQFALDLFKTEIANFPLLHDFFENESIYWMDDIDLICTMVLKTIKQINENSDEHQKILTLYKDEEDEKEFITTLISKAIEKNEENDRLVDTLTQNWELDRIAKMDVILLKMALTELTEHSSIPKKVTLNEYIEISKYYSTPKSQVFINGILDKAVELLDKEGKLNKSGRGLIN
jgi:N utilization substance protein B